ncbi:DUF4097 family beta strand repeat-containing protein [Lysinibacillus sp. KU-BSD001]|uniref:DUF4097 family beta strand repeat-containing protein n=1 Tax=Lysinibacillus sp. KU-BSD001 TaxID=3141328 RepID=UPI0036EF68BF
MTKKVLFALLLGTIIVIITIFMKQQPAEKITMGEYTAMPQIDVTLDVLSIAINNSPDDKIHVHLQGHKLKKDLLTITEENNRLFITEKKRKTNWLENIRFRSAPTIIVQLPKSQNNALTLNTENGDATIQDLPLDTVQLNTSTGNVNLNNTAILHAELRTKDGTVTITKSAIDNLSITTSAGDVAIKESTGLTHTIETTDGQIKMTEATEQPNIHVKSTSGDINIHYKKTPTSLQLMMTSEDTKITLPKYDKKTHTIGDGANILSAETKYGFIVIE